MKNNDINGKILRALQNAAPDDVGDVLSRVESKQEKGCVIEVTETKTKKKFSTWQRVLVAACLVLAVLGGVGGFLLGQANAVVSIVSLDVNPGIELSINNNKTVLSCRGVNSDAQKLLSDMGDGRDLEGVKLDVAVNAIVGALVRSGYLNNLSSAILISVEDNDQERGARIQQELVDYIDGVLEVESSQASVFSQSATRSDHEELAHKNDISTGKATLISNIIAANGIKDDDAFSKLSRLSVKELMEMKRTGDGRIPIGEDLAAAAAKEYAGVGSDVTVKVDSELDETPPYYEVDILTGKGKYEYKVDAFTGEVLAGIPDINTSAPKDMISQDKAVEIAKAHMIERYPELAEIELTKVRGKLDTKEGEYEIDFDCGTYSLEYEIDAYTGAVLDWDIDRISGGTAAPTVPGSDTTAPNETDIGDAAAKAAAFKHAGVSESDVTNLKVEREYDDGRLEYEVDFRVGGTKYDYTIDGATGNVISYDIEKTGQTPSDTTTPVTNPPTVADIGAEKAKDIAFTHSGVSENGVTNLKVERDYDDGRLEYEVEFYAGGAEYEYKIDGKTGAILSHDVESKTHHDDHDSGGTKDIGAEKAKAAAFAHAGVSEADVRSLKVEREHEHGRIEYEIEFKVGAYEYEYTIDGATGATLSHEKDHDD